MRRSTAAIAVLSVCIAAHAQESVRDLERPGEQHKHLTRDTVDHWRLVAEAGEVFRVEVSSREFDPVLSFVTAEGEVLVGPVDDPGSESKLQLRLESGGEYEILVHGPDKRGGGNYRLHVERFSTKPLGADGSLASHLPADGVDHVRFDGEEGAIVMPVGAPVAEVIDPKGEGLREWHGSYTLTRSGEHYVRLRGERAQPYELRVHHARRHALEPGAAGAPAVHERPFDGPGIDVWEWTAAEGDFRSVELVHTQRCEMRVLYADPDEDRDDLRARAELHYVPVHSKGGTQRLAILFPRAGRAQIQVLSTSTAAHRYRLAVGDPTRPAPLGESVRGTLAIGDSAFWRLDARPGQLVRVDVHSEHFDPMISVKRPDGTNIGGDDDGGRDLASRYTFLVTETGPFRVHVTCYGNGGGGAYAVEARALEIPVLALGERGEAEMPGPGTGYWHFDGTRDQTVFVSVHADALDMAVALRDPNGVLLGTDDDAGVGHDPLLALRLPADGRYTIVATGKSGAGAYRIRVLDPDAG